MAVFTPTKQQEAVTSYFKAQFEQEHGLVSIFLNACAGSGKTATIMLEVEALAEIERKLGRTFRACSLSFNTNIRDASQLKLTAMGSTVQAKTTNQLGRSILVNAAKAGLCRELGKLDNKKYRSIVEDLMCNHMNNRSYFANFREYGKAVTAAITLISAVRSTRKSAKIEDILYLIEHYNLQDKIDIMAPYFDLLIKVVGAAIEEGIKQFQLTGKHDFDDQIILPLDLDVAAPEWDVIFIDEAQDLNRARLEMITRCIKPNGILFFVGDPSQAIQGFTFADTHSVETIKSVTNAVEFLLSVSWRCDADIIALAQILVPHIEARPNAKAGLTDCIAKSGYIEKLQSGAKDSDPDLVLSRIKAPLVSDCLAAIRAGKSAIVRGRDIGSGIVSFLEDALSKAGFISDFETLVASAEDYTLRKISKLNPNKDELKMAELSDQMDTIEALADGYQLAVSKELDMEDFKRFIESKFSDTTDTTNEQGIKPIVFSTIHKAKGLEYDRVFIIETDKLPHPAAKDGWQKEQEYNILYVAVTRAKHELYFVGSIPTPLLLIMDEELEPEMSPTELEEEVTPAPFGFKADGVTPKKRPGKGKMNKPEEEMATHLQISMPAGFKAFLNAWVKSMDEASKSSITVSSTLMDYVMRDDRFLEFVAQQRATKANLTVQEPLEENVSVSAEGAPVEAHI